MLPTARWIALGALFLIPFIPLYVSTDLFFPFITGKNFAFRILVEIAVAAWAVLAIYDRRYRPQFSWIAVIFALFVAWMALANIFGVYPTKAFWSNFERMDGWVTLIHLFGFFMAASTIFRVEERWRTWLLTFVVGAMLVSGYAIMQLGGLADIHQGGMRLTATMGNAIYLAVYMMAAMFFAFLLAVSERRWLRWAFIGFIPLACFILFFTGSRGPLVGLGVGAGVAMLLWFVLAVRGEKRTEAVWWGIRAIIGIVIVTVLAIGTLFAFKDHPLVTENFFLARAASVFNLEKELTVRGTIWSIALTGAKERPLLGYGQEGFNQVFNRHFDPTLYDQETWFDRVHNTYLDWLIAGGVPALILFVLLLGLAGSALVRAPHLSREERVILLGALIAYAVQALVVFDNLFSYVSLMVLLAIAYGTVSRPVAALEQAPEVQQQNLRLIVAAVAVVGVSATVWLVNVPGIRAANQMIEVVRSASNLQESYAQFDRILVSKPFALQEVREQLVRFTTELTREEGVAPQVIEQFANRAVQEMEAQIALVPGDARNYVQYATALDAAGRPEDALAAIDAAIALSPTKQALHLARAERLRELGRTAEARAALLHTYNLSPQVPSVVMQVAAALILADDIPQAQELLRASVGTTTPDSDALFFAYYETKRWDDLVAVAEARVVATEGSPESRLRLAQALAAAGRFAAARELTAETIELFPQVRSAGEELLMRLEAFR